MDAIFGPLSGELIKLGLPGIVIIGLSIALWREREENRKCAENRVSDAKVCWSALTENTEATRSHTKALEMLADILRASR